MTSIGIVVIGRNVGERLRRCLTAVRATGMPCVYVDSGSTDGSVKLAEAIVGHVIELDCSSQFSAARGRNEGFKRLLSLYPELLLVQFVDGDCVLDSSWIARASRELLARPDLAIVCGRLREVQPEASIYNTLCDIEWNRPAGSVAACGGIFMARVEAFNQVGGFDPAISAGEEPELCLRLRRDGWRIWRIDAPMAEHDAAMFHVHQWWRRAVRSGRCVLENLVRPSSRGEVCDLRRVASISMWTVGIPLAALLAAWLTGGWGSLLWAAYPVQWCRLWWRHRRRLGLSVRASMIGATFTFIGKFAELVGLVQAIRGVVAGKAVLRPRARTPLHAQTER